MKPSKSSASKKSEGRRPKAPKGLRDRQAAEAGVSRTAIELRRARGWPEADLTMPAYSRSTRSPARILLEIEAKRLGISPDALEVRIARHGMDAALAAKRFERLKAQPNSRAAICRKFGVARSAVEYHMVQKKLPLMKAIRLVQRKRKQESRASICRRFGVDVLTVSYHVVVKKRRLMDAIRYLLQKQKAA